MQHTTITSWARLIWEGLRTYGVDADALFIEVGLDPSALTDSNARYPVPAMGRLWNLAVERSGDPCFGLTAAAQWHATTWHGLGYAWLASSTLEEALRRITRYGAVLSTAADFRMARKQNGVRLTLSAKKGVAAKASDAVIDAVLANVVYMCRATYGPDFSPSLVEFIHPGDGCRQRRGEFFKAPVVYRGGENALEIAADVVAKPLATANADLAHANEKVIADYLAQLKRETTVARVQAKLIDGLSSGNITAQRVAKSLFVSQRTLQRQLATEGTSFTTVLEETRRELAERFIRDQSLTLIEITFLLGFSEISSFSRAFKRWTGLAPTEFRSQC